MTAGSSDQKIHPFGDSRSSVHELIQQPPSSQPGEGGNSRHPSLCHDGVAGTERACVDVRAVSIKGVHARRTGGESDILTPYRCGIERKTTVGSHSMAECRGSKAPRPHHTSPAEGENGSG